MSKKVGAHIKCPSCGTETEFHLYRSLWIEDPENRKMVFEDRVNLFECPSCGRSERAQFPFLCTNKELGLAVWYEPYRDAAIDKDVEGYKKQMGANSFYATAPRISDWEDFKRKIIEIENTCEGVDIGIEISDESATAFKGFIDYISAEVKSTKSNPEEETKNVEGNNNGHVAPQKKIATEGQPDKRRKGKFTSTQWLAVFGNTVALVFWFGYVNGTYPHAYYNEHYGITWPNTIGTIVMAACFSTNLYVIFLSRYKKMSILAAALNVSGIGVLLSLIIRYPNDVVFIDRIVESGEYLYEIRWLPLLGALGGSIYFVLHIYHFVWGPWVKEIRKTAHDLKMARMGRELHEELPIESTKGLRATNWKRGLFRIWIAFSIPWMAYWGWAYLDSKANYAIWQSFVDTKYELLINSDQLFKDGTYSRPKVELQRELDEVVDLRDEQADIVDRAAHLGPVVPASLLILFGLGYWVRRGFYGSD